MNEDIVHISQITGFYSEEVCKTDKQPLRFRQSDQIRRIAAYQQVHILLSQSVP